MVPLRPLWGSRPGTETVDGPRVCAPLPRPGRRLRPSAPAGALPAVGLLFFSNVPNSKTDLELQGLREDLP